MESTEPSKWTKRSAEEYKKDTKVVLVRKERPVDVKEQKDIQKRNKIQENSTFLQR